MRPLPEGFIWLVHFTVQTQYFCLKLYYPLSEVGYTCQTPTSGSFWWVAFSVLLKKKPKENKQL